MGTKNIPHKRGYLDSHSEEILRMLNKRLTRKKIAALFNEFRRAIVEALEGGKECLGC